MRIYINYRALGTNCAAIFFSDDHSLYCAPITSDECHAWFHWMGSVDIQGAHGQQKNTKWWKILVNSGTRTHHLTIRSQNRNRLSSPGLMEALNLMWYIKCDKYMYFLYIGISSRRDEAGRILSCTCTALCYILGYIFIGQIAKTQKSCVCFQHAKSKIEKVPRDVRIVCM